MPSFASEIPSVSADLLFELLADCRRRAVLSYLEHTDAGDATVSDLAAYVSQHPGASDSPKRVLAQLHHAHLPKLAQVGLLEYDAEANTVQYVGHPLIEDCLALVEDE